MKSLLVASAHGGTGRTTLVCQFAHYLRLVRGYRVLVIDLAEPACSAMSLARGPCASRMKRGANDIQRSPSPDTAAPRMGVLAADAIAGIARRDDPLGARCYANLRHLFSQVAPSFDVCLIDSPPWPDPRAICAAALVDALVSPILLSPDTLGQVAEFVNGSNGVRNVRARLNPSLCFVGIVPNCVELTRRQQAQLKWIEASVATWLVPHAQVSAGYLRLPRLDAITQAQACGISVADLARVDSTLHTEWHALSECFDTLARHLDHLGESASQSGVAEVCGA
ncbi:ParA family protein [Burkholderia sp. Ac-20353]|uniref:ParA family protein n=1 Tax=Burkholderia sp. Ac-20353 TaxID=2703894 RepID=UPI00197C4199|nr:ParA family protein [Burkholderia sp. Ac-20353]MBN3787506.1 ParA family protein [Burkholderia sp. Ac-20353]